MAPKQTDPQFKLRMTPEIKDAIEAAAKADNRSMNAEILSRLEDSFRKSDLAETPIELKTLRLDPKIRFMLEFVARLKGQTITTVIERAIQDAADLAQIKRNNGRIYTWKNFWDVEQGVRDILISGEQTLRPTFKEEKRLEFTSKYWPFFFTDVDKVIMQRHYISVLWNRIDEFIEFDEDPNITDFWAAGYAMENTLKSVQLTPPKWKELLGV